MATSPALPRCVRFADFEVDLRAGELRKHGRKLRLQEQPFQILTMLLERPGDVVTREELREKLWPSDTFVDFDHGLNNAVNRLREALCDSAENPRYIETLPRRGYRFISAVDVASAPVAPPIITQPSFGGAGKESIASGQAAPTEGTPLAASRARFARVWLAAGVPLAAAALLLGFNVGRLRERVWGMAMPGHIQSIAVLPLENLSGDPSQEYFADGMTDALTTDLAQYAPLRVISRTSVMQFKGARKPLPLIAHQLNVDAIVEGSVSRSGSRVRITAQLIRASTDQHLWAQTYERDVQDILRLQSEISRDIAEQVEIKLSPEGTALRPRPPQMNPEAYDLYLKGRFYLAKRTEESMTKAAEYFQEAIQKDPNSALAYSGLANAYGLLADFGFGSVSAEEGAAKSKAAALKAVALDDTLPEALTALAFHADGGPGERERLLRRAIQINPNYAQGHHWYARFLSFRGRMDEATAEIEKARELDPVSPIVNANAGEIYFRSRKFDKAIEQLTRTLALDPNFARTHLDLAMVYRHVGRFDEAIAESQKSRILGGENWPEMLVPLQRAYEKDGYRGYYQAELELLKERSRSHPVSPLSIAFRYELLGDKDQAIATLEKAYRECPNDLLDFKWDPDFDDLRSDPRFADIIRRLESPANTKPN